ncbi:MAG: GNAT family N-acetyltransferase [Phyllobacteriaceae bacterium]|nr:GNAT family N-acetyltransferase [Phyllobacteriaceae bacterium]
MTFPAEGYGDLPPGLLAAAVTYLEMRAAPPARASDLPAGVRLEPLTGADVPRYRRLFAAVGEDWLWFGRRMLDDAALAAILGDPAVSTHAVVRDGADVGLVELDGRVAGEVELAYFGLVAAAVGSGLGRALMTRTLAEAWSCAPKRVWVHTCHFDHPGALDFYRRSGFVPYARALEFGPDPRLTGLLPRDAAPHVPLIDPDRG